MDSMSNSFDEMHGANSEHPESSGGQSNGLILEQDRFLPIANISRIMKRVIPPEGKLSKEAKECVQECISEFLLFITSEASERCAILNLYHEKRKTISGEDILLAFKTLGFDEYVAPLEEFLKKYREANKLQNGQIGTACNEESQVNQEADDISDQPVIYLQEQQLLTTANGEVQPVQVFFDAVNGQYFIPVQDGDGSSSLLHVNVTSTNDGALHIGNGQN